MLNCVGKTDKNISMHIHNNFILSVPLYHLPFAVVTACACEWRGVCASSCLHSFHATNSRCHHYVWPFIANTSANCDRVLFSVCQRSHFHIKRSNNTHCILVEMNYFRGAEKPKKKIKKHIGKRVAFVRLEEGQWCWFECISEHFF